MKPEQKPGTGVPFPLIQTQLLDRLAQTANRLADTNDESVSANGAATFAQKIKPRWMPLQSFR